MESNPEWCLYWIPLPQDNIVQPSFWFFPVNSLTSQNDAIHYNPTPSVSAVAPVQKINKQRQNTNIKTAKEKYSEQNSGESNFSLPQENNNSHFEQKSGRNSASNILRTFTKFLKLEDFKLVYETVVSKQNTKIIFKEFFSWMAGAGFSVHKYVRIKKIIKAIQKRPHKGKILALLYRYFEARFAIPMILTSNKTDNKNIIPTLKQVRKIRKGIEKAIQEGFNRK